MSDLIRVDAAAKMLGISARKVYELAKTRQLAHYRIGGSVRLSPKDIEEYLQQCRSATTPAISAGALSSTAQLLVAGSALADYFQKATPAPKHKRSTSQKQSACTALHLVPSSKSR